MGRFRTLLVTAAAVACPILAQGGGEAGNAIRAAAEISAGKPLVFSASRFVAKEDTAGADPQNAETRENEAQGIEGFQTGEAAYEPFFCETAEPNGSSAETAEPLFETAETLELPADRSGYEGEQRTVIESTAEGVPAGTLISRNIFEFTEEPAEEDGQGGRIERVHYGNSLADDHITLSGGAQVRNLTQISSRELSEAAEQLPEIKPELGSDEPQVLIIHTHTTESYEPVSSDEYSSSRTCRTRDSTRNMVAIGETLGRELAARGITVLHDGTIHDYPAYSGAYDRSEDTIRAALAEYPSIKIIIDLHRDAIENSDGTRIAPVTEIDGKSAAQFMIITGCDDGRFGNMPDYMENFKLACLIQNCAEELYPGLARPVLFDYRNYNQHLSTGSLLIEVGGHANSFDEAEYTGRLLGEIIAAAAAKLS